jgi:hypothetical protein
VHILHRTPNSGKVTPLGVICNNHYFFREHLFRNLCTHIGDLSLHNPSVITLYILYTARILRLGAYCSEYRRQYVSSFLRWAVFKFKTIPTSFHSLPFPLSTDLCTAFSTFISYCPLRCLDFTAFIFLIFLFFSSLQRFPFFFFVSFSSFPFGSTC